MNKKDKINLILSKLKEKIDELDSYNDPEVDQMSAEETVSLALGLVSYSPMTMEYNQPIGIIDRTRVSFVLDEEFEIPIGDKENDEDQILSDE